jgi:hypothetical protein
MKTRRRKLRWWMVIVGLIVIVVLGGGLLLLSANGGPMAMPASSFDGSRYDYLYPATEAPLPEDSMALPSLLDLRDVQEARVQPAAQVPNRPIANPPVQQGETRLIIKNGVMTLLVDDIEASMAGIARLAEQNGGYVLDSSLTTSGGRPSGEMRIAVRADQFEAVMAHLRTLGREVLHEQSTGTDVTEEYVDLQAQLRNLEATRDQLQIILDAARTVDETLNVYTKLAEIEGQIERIKGRINYLEGRAAQSEIYVGLVTEVPVLGQWSFGEQVRQAAFTQQRVFRAVISGLIWLIVVAGPYLVVLGLVAFGVWRWRMRALDARLASEQAADSAGET